MGTSKQRLSDHLECMSTLRGKVLGCWCHPPERHSYVIAEIVDRESARGAP